MSTCASIRMLRTTVFLASALLLLGSSFAQNVQTDSDDSGNWKVVARVLNECSQQDEMSLCFKMKAVNFLDKMLTSKSPVAITDYVTLARDLSEKNYTDDKLQRESNWEASLPRSLNEKNDKVDELLWNKFVALLKTRTLQFNDISEARGKDPFKGGKKGGGMMMVAAMMTGMMMKMAMGKIALIAGKALIIAKIALVLAAVIGLKKLASGGGGGGDSHPQVVYATAEHGGGGWQRRNYDAHDLAYGSQTPEYQ